MVVGEDDAQAAVFTVPVLHGVCEPALGCDPCPLVFVAETCGEAGHHSRGVCGFEMMVGYSVDALDHHTGGERPVLVVPAVGRAVRRGQVPLGQVDVLPDDVRGRPHLVVVHLELLGDQVRVEVLGAVVGVQPHDEGLGGLQLVDGVFHVVPEGDDPLLRVVVAHLVEDGVDLDVRALVGEGGARVPV